MRINIYEGKRYPFEKCEYVATTDIEIKHVGMINPCNEWETTTLQAMILSDILKFNMREPMILWKIWVHCNFWKGSEEVR